MSIETIKCKQCLFFTRGKWHKAVDPAESNQCGGTCAAIAKVLGHTNAQLFFIKELYVMEDFGCVIGELNKSE